MAESKEKKWKCSNLGTDLAALLESGTMSDVTLITQDQPPQEIRSHKLVLAARSSVFAATFSSPESTPVIEVPAAFSDFLQYIYCGEIQLNSDNVSQVYWLAHKYDTPELPQACVIWVEAHTKDCWENVMNYFSAFSTETFHDILSPCTEHLPSCSYLQIVQLSYEAMFLFLARWVHSLPDRCFLAVCYWIRTHAASEKIQLSFFSKVCFGDLSAFTFEAISEWWDDVKPHPTVQARYTKAFQKVLFPKQKIWTSTEQITTSGHSHGSISLDLVREMYFGSIAFDKKGTDAWICFDAKIVVSFNRLTVFSEGGNTWAVQIRNSAQEEWKTLETVELRNPSITLRFLGTARYWRCKCVANNAPIWYQKFLWRNVQPTEDDLNVEKSGVELDAE